MQHFFSDSGHVAHREVSSSKAETRDNKKNKGVLNAAERLSPAPHWARPLRGCSHLPAPRVAHPMKRPPEETVFLTHMSETSTVPEKQRRTCSTIDLCLKPCVLLNTNGQGGGREARGCNMHCSRDASVNPRWCCLTRWGCMRPSMYCSGVEPLARVLTGSRFCPCATQPSERPQPDRTISRVLRTLLAPLLSQV